MTFLSKKIEAKIKHLLDEYESNKFMLHQGLKGSLNENGLASLIKDVIPSRYKITKGLIENQKGEQSNETDLIIYDDDILPPYIKNDLSVVPVEAVKYVFEVKSKLDSSELKTTIYKYKNFHSIGGTSPSVLVAYSSDIKGSELARYYKLDDLFLTNPAISVFCVFGKSYYYKTAKEYYLKDFFSNTEWLKLVTKSLDIDYETALDEYSNCLNDNSLLDSMNRSDFARLIKSAITAQNHKNNINKNEITFNGIKLSNIKFKIHQWIGIDNIDYNANNDIELSILAGISNTLSKSNFGNYLLNDRRLNVNIFGVCFEDMWGNLSCMDFNTNGIKYDINKFSFSYETNGSENTHKIIFTILNS